MKLKALAALAIGLPAMAFAATEIDANGDGVLTLDEVQAVYPEISVESFSAMDLNSDGALDDAESVAAQDAGLLPKSRG
ncbi:hypothetical protein AB9K34_23065 [Sedimentitalea sp. XS_ASV28]|uniref:hypothetical protein n=1 Tax=Sedimentitalea sp. XS_ASV28 TaxID=3241296 RepID=UPI0035196AA0